MPDPNEKIVGDAAIREDADGQAAQGTRQSLDAAETADTSPTHPSSAPCANPYPDPVSRADLLALLAWYDEASGAPIIADPDLRTIQSAWLDAEDPHA